MVSTDEWNEAVTIAGIKKLNFPVGQLDVEAYHVSFTEDACRGVIHGVRPEFTNEQIRQKTKAFGYEVLDARRLGKSHSVVIVFAGNNIPFTVSFNWLETPCFIYKKTKAACLNCGEVGHRAVVCSKPAGFSYKDPDVDKHLLHLWEARQALTKRWKRQRHNKVLRKKIAELTAKAEEYAIKLASRNWLTYGTPYLKLNKTKLNKLNAILRKAYKNTLGLPEWTATDKLLRLGVHNSMEELHEAQIISQLKRLDATTNGKWLLDRLGMAVPGGTQVPGGEEEIDHDTKQKFKISKLPKNMHPERDEGRRRARTAALAHSRDNREGTLYVDAAGPSLEVAAIAVASAQGKILRVASIRADSAEQAEEAAIALAVSCNPQATVITDSHKACRNYARGVLGRPALRILKKVQVQAMGVHLIWAPVAWGIQETRRLTPRPEQLFTGTRLHVQWNPRRICLTTSTWQLCDNVVGILAAPQPSYPTAGHRVWFLYEDGSWITPSLHPPSELHGGRARGRTVPPRTLARQGRPREPWRAATPYSTERQLARIKEDHVECSRLLETIQSNKVAASRALSQNKELNSTGWRKCRTFLRSWS
ncbi:hypothetical protein HPB47_002067 [Ixodes persulcatus]|uniref:Uncharacterized protein n=1 Tax=Ixodes persulcatus TaxID=34615 RepID=A0AC60PMC5_IXOPE|nr:hypothetical protein HPB47_002067 [Ixodes persulcatus]